MADLKAAIKELTAKTAKMQSVSKESMENTRKIIEAAKAAAKTPQGGKA